MKCIFCGKSAGFFKREHSECRAIAESGKKYLQEWIDYVFECRDCMNITDIIVDTVAKFNIPMEMVKKLFLESWNKKVLDAFADGEIDAEEIKILQEMLIALRIDPSDFQKSQQWQQLMAYGKRKISNLIDSLFKRSNEFAIEEEINNIAQLYGFDQAVIKQCALECWKRFLNNAFDDGVLDEFEEAQLNKVADFFDFNESDVQPYRMKIVKGAILRDVLNGVIPQRLNITNQLPIVLQKNESVIWLYNNVSAYEDRIRRHYTGGSVGLSVRVAKGVYLRSGSFKGHPVETTETTMIGNGCLIVTNKTIFWISSSKSIKIPLKKLVSVIPRSDGLILQKDGVSAKPLTLVLDDPWFICNLITNLNLIQ